MYRSDALIVAGDVAERLDKFRETMRALTETFGLVFYTPGNHELWCLRDGTEGATSLEKLRRLDSICNELGIITSPQRVNMVGGGRLHVCPLVSFHHISFDTEPDVRELRLPSVQRAMADFRACRFPEGLQCGSQELARHIDRYNAIQLRASAAQAAAHPALLTPWTRWERLPRRDAGEPLLTFSHFLPRIELCPEKRFLRYPDLLKAVGSAPLGRRVAELQPDVHIFGHTHFGWDATLDDGTRYIQAALATPEERRYRMKSLAIGSIQRAPLKVYDGELARFCPPNHAAWSSYYRTNPRTPDETFPAPWVLDHYSKRAPSRVVLDGGATKSGGTSRAGPAGVGYKRTERSAPSTKTMRSEDNDEDEA